MKIPSQYLPVMPYLILRDAKGFWDYAQQVFGAIEQYIVPSEDGGIMHAEIKIHDAVIMFANSTNDWPEKSAGMFLFVEDVDGVYAAAIKKMSTSLMEPRQQDYGYTAGFEDPYGNQWWITAGEK